MWLTSCFSMCTVTDPLFDSSGDLSHKRWREVFEYLHAAMKAVSVVPEQQQQQLEKAEEEADDEVRVVRSDLVCSKGG